MKKAIAAATIAALLAATLLYFFCRGEEARVKKQFRRLGDLVSVEPGESTIQGLARAKALSTLFADSCTVNAGRHVPAGTYSHEQMTGMAIQARSRLEKASVRFSDFSIEFPDSNTCRTAVTAMFNGKLTNGDGINETRELNCVLVKIDNKWLFSEISEVEVLVK